MNNVDITTSNTQGVERRNSLPQISRREEEEKNGSPWPQKWLTKKCVSNNNQGVLLASLDTRDQHTIRIHKGEKQCKYNTREKERAYLQ